MLAYYQNFKRFHELEALVTIFNNKGRGRGGISYEHQRPENLELFWIKRLEEVITWLKTKLGIRTTESASEISASTAMDVLSSRSTVEMRRTVPQRPLICFSRSFVAGGKPSSELPTAGSKTIEMVTRAKVESVK
jgi:hypothetical protein